MSLFSLIFKKNIFQIMIFMKIILIIKNIKDIIPKKIIIIIYNIGNFIFNLLFRESPNYKIIIDRKGNKFYKIIIPDYKIIDYDKHLFDFLHFLLDFEENNKINDNLNLLNEEEDSLKLYFSHNYFNETLSKEININYQSKEYFFKKLSDN